VDEYDNIRLFDFEIHMIGGTEFDIDGPSVVTTIYESIIKRDFDASMWIGKLTGYRLLKGYEDGHWTWWQPKVKLGIEVDAPKDVLRRWV
jgi:hypothetical protein